MEASKRNGTNASDHTYDNPNFQTDLERGRSKQDGGKGRA